LKADNIEIQTPVIEWRRCGRTGTGAGPALGVAAAVVTGRRVQHMAQVALLNAGHDAIAAKHSRMRKEREYIYIYIYIYIRIYIYIYKHT
jgi:hypothetical protein